MSVDFFAECEVKDDTLLVKLPSVNSGQRVTILELWEEACAKSHGFLRFTLALPSKKRSIPQNSAFHKICSLIGNEMGMTLEEVKQEIKYRAISRGYPCRLDNDGNMIINALTGRPYPLSSHDRNTVEMGYLMDEALQVCAFLGIESATQCL